MKVYSLYYKDTFVVAYPNREDVVDYGKKYYDEYAWDCNIIEEYLSKSPLLYSSPLTSLTPQQTIPCNTGITLLPGTPQINNSVRAEPYKDVRAYWEEK
jgi:hypothetical protein